MSEGSAGSENLIRGLGGLIAGPDKFNATKNVRGIQRVAGAAFKDEVFLTEKPKPKLDSDRIYDLLHGVPHSQEIVDKGIDGTGLSFSGQVKLGVVEESGSREEYSIPAETMWHFVSAKKGDDLASAGVGDVESWFLDTNKFQDNTDDGMRLYNSMKDDGLVTLSPELSKLGVSLEDVFTVQTLAFAASATKTREALK